MGKNERDGMKFALLILPVIGGKQWKVSLKHLLK
jgi:hypothetical protein